MNEQNVTLQEAERTVIGIMLKRPEKVRDIREMLRADDFANPTRRAIFKAVEAISARGEEADIVTADAECARLYPGLSFMDEMIECATRSASAAMVETYCGIVREASTRRSAREIAEELMRSAQEPDADIMATIEDTRRRLADLTRTAGRVMTQADVLLSTYEYIEKMASGKVLPSPGGLSTIDKFTGGFYPGELTIFGARPGVGKTAFAIASAIACVMAGKKPFFISAEMRDTQIGQRLFADASGVNAMRLRKPTGMTAEDWDALSHALVKWCEFQISYFFERNADVILNQARRQRDRGECDILFVDYIQLLTTRKKFEADRLRVEYISHELKALALELDIPVIGLAQLNRPGKGAERYMPRLESLRDSGALEQDADGVILIHRPETIEDEVFDIFKEDKARFEQMSGTGKQLIYFNVAKQRQGMTAICGALYDGAHSRYAPLEKGGEAR